MIDPQITIGVPFYNDEEYLDAAIKSVFAQTYTNWKLILVNDGGTDDSLRIANKYKDDPRVTIYSDGKNHQLPFRLNLITQLASTKYLARMDADDIMHPKRLETQIKILENDPSIDIIGSNAYTIDENNNVTGVRYMLDKKNACSLQKVKGFIHPSIMGKSEWFKKNQYDANAIRIEDTELWHRTVKFSNFQIINEPLLFYREFGGGYYKKYFKVLSTFPYLWKKYKGDSFWYIAFVKRLFIGLIYFIADLFGLEDVLIKRRGCPISEEEQLCASNILSKIIESNNCY